MALTMLEPGRWPLEVVMFTNHSSCLGDSGKAEVAYKLPGTTYTEARRVWGWGHQPVVLGAEHPVRNRVTFTSLNSFHSSADLAPADRGQFKWGLWRIWFNLHARSKMTELPTTANFEHVFLGEIDNNTG